jgi:hypothetical protein
MQEFPGDVTTQRPVRTAEDDLVNPRFIEPHTSAHCGLLVHCLEWTVLARERLVRVFRDVRMPSVYERVTIEIDRCILDLSGSDRSN